MSLVEITAKHNGNLIDKSDREGLLDNEQFQDFHHILVCAIKAFQLERNKERLKIKSVKRADARIKKLKEKLSEIESILKSENVSKASREKIHENIFEIQDEISKALDDNEEPLLAAAAIGLTYMIPTHEVERDIQESYKAITKIIKKTELEPDKKLKIVNEHLYHADDILQGTVKLSQTNKTERFKINQPIDFAVKLLRSKLARNNITIDINIQIKENIVGSSRMISIALLNLLDNSIFWLNKKSKDKHIKITFAEHSKKYFQLVVSDNGPGLRDDIDFLSRPFVTRKTTGMGLGLYICARIAQMHKGKLISLDEFDSTGLQSGANIALLIPKGK